MKIAVLADIHANLPALEAVTADLESWKPDRVILAGDVINRGPRSPECLRFVLGKIKSNGWQVLKGNHEDYVIAQGLPDSPRWGPLFHVYRHTQWTYEQLDGAIDSLWSWPDFIYLEGPGKCEVRVAHGSMLGNTYGIFPMMDNGELLQRVGEPLPTLFCCGHTHYPLITQLDGALVVNVGAVGLPFDGDRRGCYARFAWRTGKWEGEIVRVKYDYAKTMEDFLISGFLHEAGSMPWLVLAEFLHAGSQLFAWMRDYYERVLGGETTVEASVQEQLEKQGLWEEIQSYL